MPQPSASTTPDEQAIMQLALQLAAQAAAAGEVPVGAVVAPDLIGFGKSDKPKRADFHRPDWHLRCVQELM